MKANRLFLTLSLVAVGSLIYGCGAKQVKTTEVPKETPVPVEKPVVSDHYTVAAKDTLWGIAGKSDIYSDNFQWPLIFKANRDEIKDPDLIYVKQDFKIEKGLSSEEVSHARTLASKTPKFVPHAKVRETLPVDYF